MTSGFTGVPAPTIAGMSSIGIEPAEAAVAASAGEAATGVAGGGLGRGTPAARMVLKSADRTAVTGGVGCGGVTTGVEGAIGADVGGIGSDCGTVAGEAGRGGRGNALLIGEMAIGDVA